MGPQGAGASAMIDSTRCNVVFVIQGDPAPCSNYSFLHVLPRSILCCGGSQTCLSLCPVPRQLSQRLPNKCVPERDASIPARISLFQ